MAWVEERQQLDEMRLRMEAEQEYDEENKIIDIITGQARERFSDKYENEDWPLGKYKKGARPPPCFSLFLGGTGTCSPQQDNVFYFCVFRWAWGGGGVGSGGVDEGESAWGGREYSRIRRHRQIKTCSCSKSEEEVCVHGASVTLLLSRLFPSGSLLVNGRIRHGKLQHQYTCHLFLQTKAVLQTW